MHDPPTAATNTVGSGFGPGGAAAPDSSVGGEFSPPPRPEAVPAKERLPPAAVVPSSPNAFVYDEDRKRGKVRGRSKRGRSPGAAARASEPLAGGEATIPPRRPEAVPAEEPLPAAVPPSPDDDFVDDDRIGPARGKARGRGKGRSRGGAAASSASDGIVAALAGGDDAEEPPFPGGEESGPMEPPSSAPGAYPERGGDGDAGRTGPGGALGLPERAGEENGGRDVLLLPTAIPAALVADDEEGLPTAAAEGGGGTELPLVFATKDERRRIDWRDGRVRMGLGLIAAVVVALSVGLGVSLSGGGDGNGDGNGNVGGKADIPPGSLATPQPSTPPSLAPSSDPTRSAAPSSFPSGSPSSRPTYLEWFQTGQEIESPGSFLNFGSAVSLSDDGSRVAVGTPSRDGGGSSGSVHVFERRSVSSKATWEALSLFAIEGDGPDDQAGRALFLSGNGSILAVGYPFNSNNGTEGGMARVFEFDAGGRTWDQIGRDLHAPLTVGASDTAGANFGYSLALSRDGMVVAVATRSGAGGIVSVFRRSFPPDGAGKCWTPLGGAIEAVELNDSNTNVPDPFAQGSTSVAISANGTRVAVVDSGDEDVTQGFLRVYGYDSSSASWIQIGTTRKGSVDYFGSSLGMSDDGGVVAVAGLRGGGYADGVVNVYRLEPDPSDPGLLDWVWRGALDDGDGFLVRTVSLSGDGNRIAVQESGGVVRICDYDEEGQVWVQAANEIEAAGVPEFRFDGETVSLASKGLHVAIGAPEIGTVRLFSLAGV